MTEEGQGGALGLGLGRGLAGEVASSMRNPLVVLWRCFGAPSGMLAEHGGSAAQGSPALACSGPYGAPGLRNLAQKARWGWDVVHQGLGSKGRPCSGVVIAGQRRRTAELEEGAAAGRLWLQDSTKRRVVLLQGPWRGQRGLNRANGEES